MCCHSWGRKESDTTERLNRTELMDVIRVASLYVKSSGAQHNPAALDPGLWSPRPIIPLAHRPPGLWSPTPIVPPGLWAHQPVVPRPIVPPAHDPPAHRPPGPRSPRPVVPQAVVLAWAFSPLGLHSSSGLSEPVSLAVSPGSLLPHLRSANVCR